MLWFNLTYIYNISFGKIQYNMLWSKSHPISYLQINFNYYLWCILVTLCETNVYLQHLLFIELILFVRLTPNKFYNASYCLINITISLISEVFKKSSALSYFMMWFSLFYASFLSCFNYYSLFKTLLNFLPNIFEFRNVVFLYSW